MSEIDRKREQIIESAMRRFTHFGIHKTTMNDIAEDMAVTQPSLYYYFPDKTSLIVAVVEKVLTEYFTELQQSLKNVTCLRDICNTMIEYRSSFTKKYFMLHLADASSDHAALDACNSVLQHYRQKEIDLLTGFIQSAIADGKLYHDNPQKVSRLYLDSITGLSMWTFSRNPQQLFPESELLDTIERRQKELTELFLRGLKYKNTKACEV